MPTTTTGANNRPSSIIIVKPGWSGIGEVLPPDAGRGDSSWSAESVPGSLEQRGVKKLPSYVLKEKMASSSPIVFSLSV
jgi:hypothetical protein